METPITYKAYQSGAITYEQYYGKVQELANINLPSDFELLVRARKSKNPHFNDVPLRLWDSWAEAARPTLTRAFQEVGDSYSIAGGVCVLKNAVRQALKQESAG